MPNIPNITPLISLNRCDTINLLLSSIALEEISLSHILNAEGEKLQLFLKSNHRCLEDFLDINESINKTLRTVVKSQILLEFKLEDVVELDRKAHCRDECCNDCRKNRCKHHSKNECCNDCRKNRCKHHGKNEWCNDCFKDRCKHHIKDECCNDCCKDRCKHHIKDECCNDCCMNRCRHQQQSKNPCKRCQDRKLG